MKFQSQACSRMVNTELHVDGYLQAGSEGKASGRHIKVFNFIWLKPNDIMLILINSMMGLNAHYTVIFLSALDEFLKEND